MTQKENSQCEIDEKYKIGKWFTGLIPCWIDAPSTLQAAHSHHGKNIVAIHLKEGGYRCCCVDDKEPTTFSLAENTPLVEGWHNRKYSCDEKAEEKAIRYDVALKRAKDILFDSTDTSQSVTKGMIEDIFPELKEPKDEKIKKAIKMMYSFLPNKPKYIGEIKVEDIFAWLEKGEKTISNMSNNNDDGACDTCKEGHYCSKSDYVKSHCWRRESL